MTGEGHPPEATSWRLLSAVVRREREGPSFEIPEAAARASLRPGDGAKLLFELRTGVERMWVVVLERRDGGYLGRLISTPAEEDAPVASGLDLEFRPQHIAAIDEPPQEYLEREFGREFVDRLCEARLEGEEEEGSPDRWTSGLIFAGILLVGALFRTVLIEALQVVFSGVKAILAW